MPEHIRVSDCTVARALADGLTRSAALGALVQDLRDLRGIVYVTVATHTRASRVAGGLSHAIVTAGETRILRVVLLRDYMYEDRAVVTLAHEFRHALEVLSSPDVRTEVDVKRLFDRIGYSRAAGMVETDAALKTERVVADELRRSRTRKAGRASAGLHDPPEPVAIKHNEQAADRKLEARYR